MDKVTFYTTIENQERNDGFGLLYDHFTDKEQAEAKLYTILAAAAVSDLPYHAGFLIRDDGETLLSGVYDRRTN